MDKETSSFEKNAVILIWVGIGVIIVSVLLFLYKQELFILESIQADKFGMFGDFVGGLIGSLWALAGVLLFYSALIYQKNELKLQRTQLTVQQKELHQQTIQFSNQNETLQKQRFENTFFQLLSLHNELVEKLSIKADGTEYVQRFVFKYGLGRLRSKIDNARKRKRDTGAIVILSYEELSLEDNKKILFESYNAFFTEHQEIFGHYFRNLYHIFKYIYLSKIIPVEEKEFYSNIVRAQLSTFELILLFYNSLIDKLGYPKFNYLIYKFDLLQNMNYGELLSNIHADIFDQLKITKDPFNQF